MANITISLENKPDGAFVGGAEKNNNIKNIDDKTSCKLKKNKIKKLS